MQSKATTVAQYLRELPADRRPIIEAVRQVILDHLDPEYQEIMQYGMIAFVVPHSVYPAGYHCDPKQALPFACLASQKNYMSLYMLTVYIEEGDQTWFQKAWEATGKKLDMGKSCIRFRKLEDLALDVIAEAVRRMPARRFIEVYENILQHQRKTTRKRSEIQQESATKRAGKKSAASPQGRRRSKSGGKKSRPAP